MILSEVARGPFVLRRADTTDDAALALVGAATFLESYAGLIPADDITHHCQASHSRQTYQGFLTSPDTACWIVGHKATGTPVGYCVVCPPDLPIDTQPDDLELRRIYVLSKFQGNGAGRLLMEAALSQAAARQAHRLLLGVYHGNDTALVFYNKAGFAEIGARQFHVGNKVYDDLILAKTIVA